MLLSELVCDEIVVRLGVIRDSQGNPGCGETIIGIDMVHERQEISQQIKRCQSASVASGFCDSLTPMQRLMDDEVIVVSLDDIGRGERKISRGEPVSRLTPK